MLNLNEAINKTINIELLFYDECEKLEITGLITRKADYINCIEFLYKPIGYQYNIDKKKIRIYPIEAKIRKIEYLINHPFDRKQGRLYKYLIDNRDNVHIILYPVMVLENFGVFKFLTSSSDNFINSVKKIIRKKGFYIRNNQLFKDRKWIEVLTEEAFFNKIGIDYVEAKDR